jgi:hypothetical protein
MVALQDVTHDATVLLEPQAMAGLKWRLPGLGARLEPGLRAAANKRLVPMHHPGKPTGKIASVS